MRASDPWARPRTVPIYCLEKVPKPQYWSREKGESRQSLQDSLSWGDGAQCKRRTRGWEPEDIVPEKRELHIKKPMEGSKGSPEASAEEWPARACEQTTWGQGINYVKAWERTVHSTHTEPGIEATANSQTGKPLNPEHSKDSHLTTRK